MTSLFHNRFLPTLTFLTGLFFVHPTSAIAQAESIFDWMHYQEVLDITLELDMDSIQRSRRTDDYQNASLSFEDKKNKVQNWKIKVKTRGKFRRQLCEMPPLKLKFKKAELAEAGLADFNDIKLVTHCVADKSEAKALLLKEYLTYQMYATLTENSYRTQLVRITYKDAKTGKKEKNWGFLIEDTAQLADRLQAEQVEIWGSTEADFAHGTAEFAALFSYMIGNADFNLTVLKNVKIFRKNGQLIPVLYDFDFSGIVNAPYAIPNTDYQLRSVKERVYLGSPESIWRLHSTQAFFHAKSDNLKLLIQNFKHLDKEVRSEMLVYMDEFFMNMEGITAAGTRFQNTASSDVKTVDYKPVVSDR